MRIKKNNYRYTSEVFDGSYSKLYTKEGVELSDGDLFFLHHHELLYLDLKGNEFNYGQILDQYQVIEKLGEGGFGSVFKVIHKETNNIYAMKTIQVEDYFSKADRADELFREQKLLKQLDHGNIIKLYHAFKVGMEICLCMEYADGGELKQYLESKPNSRVSELEARYLISQIWRAISFWHQKGIIHRDLKPENVLIWYKSYKNEELNLSNKLNTYLFSPDVYLYDYEDIIIKVSDFGIAGLKKTGTKGENTNAGTAKFMAPELQTRSDIEASTALDIWAIGIILFIMVYGYHPFKVKDRAQTIKNIIESPVKFDETVDISEEWKLLIKQMLQKDPRNRINMFNILNSRWFEMTDSEIEISQVKASNARKLSSKIKEQQK